MWKWNLSDSDSEGGVSSLELSSESDEFENFAPTVYPVSMPLVVNYVMSKEEAEFMSFYRVSHNTYWRLVRLFKKSPSSTYQVNGSNGKLEVTDQLSAFLRFAGQDSSSYRVICRSFEMSLSSLHRIVNRFTYCFSNMSRSVLSWMTAKEQSATERYFCRRGMPGVVGVLGCAHVQIGRPFRGSEAYINNDRRYSIQLQIVCNHKCKIIDVFVGYPGAAHPIEVFTASTFSKEIEGRCVSGAYRILGSNDYMGMPYLVTPHQGELNASQLRFNRLHHECSFLVQKCFALLFTKFRQLSHVKLRNIEVINNFVRACCVLHNLTLSDELQPEDEQRVVTNAQLLHGDILVTQPVAQPKEQSSSDEQ